MKIDFLNRYNIRNFCFDRMFQRTISAPMLSIFTRRDKKRQLKINCTNGGDFVSGGLSKPGRCEKELTFFLILSGGGGREGGVTALGNNARQICPSYRHNRDLALAKRNNCKELSTLGNVKTE